MELRERTTGGADGRGPAGGGDYGTASSGAVRRAEAAADFGADGFGSCSSDDAAKAESIAHALTESGWAVADRFASAQLVAQLRRETQKLGPRCACVRARRRACVHVRA
jgi:hypothetical protein